MRPRLFQLTATVALVAGLSVAALPAYAQQAGDFEKGVAAFDIGDYETAIELWQPLADTGDVNALRNMAQLYRLGLGVQQDDSAAFGLYEQAAERGSDDAQVNVAFLLLTGKGVDQDREKAASWFAKAADQGNALAQYNLGLMYEKGIGVEQDDEFSLELYRLAAAQGQRRAMARLDAVEAATAAAEIQAAEVAAAERAAEAAKAETSAETDAPEQAAKDETGPVLSIKPVSPDAPKPLEFEAASAPDSTNIPTYRPEAEQNGVDGKRPVINVVRTPTRKPGDKVADAPKGDQPTPVYIQRSTADDEDNAPAEAAEATDAAPDGAPDPAYVMKVEAAKKIPEPTYVLSETAIVEEVVPADENGQPNPAYVMKVTADDEGAARSSGDTDMQGNARTAAVPAVSGMRMPSDPVARVQMAERAYRDGRFADAAQMLAPLSDAGLPIAQFWMGRMYNRGEGVDLNRVEAYSLWRSAAAGGSERAATALANLASRLSSEEIAIAEQRHAASGRAR